MQRIYIVSDCSTEEEVLLQDHTEACSHTLDVKGVKTSAIDFDVALMCLQDT